MRAAQGIAQPMSRRGGGLLLSIFFLLFFYSSLWFWWVFLVILFFCFFVFFNEQSLLEPQSLKGRSWEGHLIPSETLPSVLPLPLARVSIATKAQGDVLPPHQACVSLPEPSKTGVICWTGLGNSVVWTPSLCPVPKLDQQRTHCMGARVSVIVGSKLEMLGGTTCSVPLLSLVEGIRTHGFPLLSEGTEHLLLGSLGSVNSHQECNRCPQQSQ